MSITISARLLPSPSLLPEVAVSILHGRPRSPLKLIIGGPAGWSHLRALPTHLVTSGTRALGVLPSPHLLVSLLLDLDPLWVRWALVVFGPLKLGRVGGLWGFKSHVDKALVIHTNLDLPGI